MMKLAIGFALVGVMALAGCGGASCKKVTCSPACDATKSKICDATSFTCVDLKMCDPVCKTDGTEMCNYISGKCEAMPTVKTCSPACTGTKYCDGKDGTCKETPVCSPVCDLTGKGEACSN